MDANVIIAFIAIVVGITVLMSLRGIIVTCHNCIAMAFFALVQVLNKQ